MIYKLDCFVLADIMSSEYAIAEYRSETFFRRMQTHLLEGIIANLLRQGGAVRRGNRDISSAAGAVALLVRFKTPVHDAYTSCKTVLQPLHFSNGAEKMIERGFREELQSPQRYSLHI